MSVAAVRSQVPGPVVPAAEWEMQGCQPLSLLTGVKTDWAVSSWSGLGAKACVPRGKPTAGRLSEGPGGSQPTARESAESGLSCAPRGVCVCLCQGVCVCLQMSRSK